MNLPCTFPQVRALQAKASMGKPIESREQLNQLLPLCVWHNAVGFFKFKPEGQVAGDLPRAPGLEGCRIHPEIYEQASKMCFDAMLDAMQGDDTPDNDETRLEATELSMSKRGATEVKELELADFAQYLFDSGEVKRGDATCQETLEACVAELLHPFMDTRGDCGPKGPLDAERAFELLSGESLTGSLRVGALTFARVTKFDAGRMSSGKLVLQLQSGLSASIAEERISSQWERVRRDDNLREYIPEITSPSSIAEERISSQWERVRPRSRFTYVSRRL